MIEQIRDQIYRIPVPLPGNPLKELNAYVIRGRDRALLIDTGFRQDPCRQALFSGLAELGLGPGQVDVLLTHLHSDHAGLAPEAAGERTIYVGAVDMPSLADLDYREWFWAKSDVRFREEGFTEELMTQRSRSNPARSMAPPEGGHYQGLEPDEVVEAGDYRLRCLLMPGHTPGQMCYWAEEQGILFTGDHVLFDITPNITAWPNMDNPLGAYLDSLRRIREYDVDLALPGHRKSGDLKRRVDELLEHHKLRLAEALSVVRAYPGQGAYELAGHMTWKIRASTWADFPIAQKWFAVGECMAHLDYLEAEGLIRCRTEDGHRRYEAT